MVLTELLFSFWFYVVFRNSKSDFEKYCAPLLYLAGYSVTVLTTEREGGARSLVENLIGETDALIVAGGDGTLSEVFLKLLLFIQLYYI